jgi:hypothetical protein
MKGNEAEEGEAFARPKVCKIWALTARDVSAEKGDDSAIEVAIQVAHAAARASAQTGAADSPRVATFRHAES